MWSRIRSLAGLSALVAAAFWVLAPTAPAFGDTGCPTAESLPAAVNGFVEIDTPGKLQKLKESSQSSAAMSANYRLTANINMSGCTWDSGISDSVNMFSGEFDGNSKSISNLTIVPASNVRPSQGFFRYLSGSVHHLTLSSHTVSTDSANNWTGGLIGTLRTNGSVSDITLTSVSVTGGNYVAGVAGIAYLNSTIQNVTLSGSVTGNSFVGGLAGDSQSSITNVTSSINVSAASYAGGLVGNSKTGLSITNSSVSGNVIATGSIAGGITGQTQGSPCNTITSVTSSGAVSSNYVSGGIVGFSQCTFLDRSSSSSVVTSTGTRAGGLIGADNNSSGTMTKSFFTGQVEATSIVGGLVGYIMTTILDSYSTGQVRATTTTGKAGGAVGEVWGPPAALTRVYAAGPVSGPASAASIGGLVGYDGCCGYIVVTSSVWDKGATGVATSASNKGTGYTTQQMKDYVLYNSDNLNWTITDGISSGNGINTGTTWSTCSGTNASYPFLTWQGLSGTCLPTMAYNENGAIGGTAPLDPTTPYTPGDTVTVLGNTGNLVKAGFVFDGWNTKANGTGVSYVAGDTFSITAPVMLFAKWLTARSISYNVNGGTGSISTAYALTGSTVTLDSGAGFTRSGYTLTRWDTASGGTGTSYAKSAVITMPASNLTLYAIWAVNRTITYNSNGGTGSISSLVAGAGTSVTLNSGSGFTRSGYTLTRWDTASGGTGTPYATGAIITMPASNTTLYAVWTVDTATTTTTTTTIAPSSVTTAPSTGPVTPCLGETSPGGVTRAAAECPSVVVPPSGGATTTSVLLPTTTTITPSRNQSAPTTSTVVPAVTTTTSPAGEPAPDLPGVGPGGTAATIGGRPADVTVTRESNELVVKVGDATVRYSVTNPDGEQQVMPLTGSLNLSPGTQVSVRVSGVARSTIFKVWMSPDGLLLGEGGVNDGVGSVTGIVPEQAGARESRLVVSTETVDGEQLVVAHGVELSKQSSSGGPWSYALIVIIGLGVVFALFIPAARRRRDDEEEAQA